MDGRPIRSLVRRGAAAGLLLAMQPSLALAANPTASVETAAQTRMGLGFATLKAEHRASQIDAFAKVLDPGPLAQLESDLIAAESTAAASSAEYARARQLHATDGSVSSKDLEAAKAQADGDSSRRDLLRQRVGLEWGPGVARLTGAARATLLRRLASGEAALLHVDTPSNEGQAGARTVDVDLGSGDQSAHGVVLGPARAAEPRLQSSGLIVEVVGKSAVLLSVGLTQSAHINSASLAQGVVIPRSAVIRFEGSDWAYVRLDSTHFERRLIQDPAPEDQGLFTASGFQPGEVVVSRGAAELFAVERAEATRQP